MTMAVIEFFVIAPENDQLKLKKFSVLVHKAGKHGIYSNNDKSIVTSIIIA